MCVCVCLLEALIDSTQTLDIVHKVVVRCSFTNSHTHTHTSFYREWKSGCKCNALSTINGLIYVKWSVWKPWQSTKLDEEDFLLEIIYNLHSTISNKRTVVLNNSNNKKSPHFSKDVRIGHCCSFLGFAPVYFS